MVAFTTIASSFCNNVFASRVNTRYIGVGALHCVVVWDMLDRVQVRPDAVVICCLFKIFVEFPIFNASYFHP